MHPRPLFGKEKDLKEIKNEGHSAGTLLAFSRQPECIATMCCTLSRANTSLKTWWI